jgi:hypothetical protein
LGKERRLFGEWCLMMTGVDADELSDALHHCEDFRFDSAGCLCHWAAKWTSHYGAEFLGGD